MFVVRSMDSFFRLYDEYQYDFGLSRTLKKTEEGVELRIYSFDKCIVRVSEDQDDDFVYQKAENNLRSYLNNHAKSATRGSDEIDNAEEGRLLLLMRAFEGGREPEASS